MVRESRTGRWFCVGWSEDPDPVQAGRQAVEGALHGTDAKLLLAFCAAERDPAGVVAGLARAAGTVPLVGNSSESVMTPAGRTEHGVVVVAIGGPGFTVATASAPVGEGGARQAGARAAGCFTAVQDSAHRVLMLLTDGYTVEQEQIIAGVYSVVGASIPLIGGSASPRYGRGNRTFQLYDGAVLDRSVIAVALGSDAPLGLDLRHGWHRVGEPMVVTHSDGGTVKTLNDQPALGMYLRRLGAPPQAYRDPTAFHRFARTRPIGVSRRAGEDIREVILPGHFTEGWLSCSAEIPEGGLVWIMESDADSILAAARQAASGAIDTLGDSPPIGLLAFDCVSRRGMLGDAGTHEEVARLTALGIPLAGMYTWGEIARTQGINAYHNMTLAVLALG